MYSPSLTRFILYTPLPIEGRGVRSLSALLRDACAPPGALAQYTLTRGGPLMSRVLPLAIPVGLLMWMLFQLAGMIPAVD